MLSLAKIEICAWLLRKKLLGSLSILRRLRRQSINSVLLSMYRLAECPPGTR